MVASDPGGLRAETEVFLTVKNINDNKEGMKETYFFLSSGHALEIIFKKSDNIYKNKYTPKTCLYILCKVLSRK